MADENGRITLNIYQPPQGQNETTEDANQTDQNLNMDYEKPHQTPGIFDNERDQNDNCPPGINNYPNQRRNSENSSDISETSDNNQNQGPTIEKPVDYPPYQQQIFYQQIQRQPIGMGQPRNANPTPVIIPYNNAYAQPVIIQGGNAISPPINNAQPTIIIQQQQKPKNTDEECFKGFLAGLAACCAICCFLSICSPGRRGRW